MGKLLVSIDPGGTTGFCVLMFPGDIVNPDVYTVHTAIEIPFSSRLGYFQHFFGTHRDEIGLIVLERFKLFGKQATMQAQINSEFPSVRVIGIVEAYAYIHGLHSKIVFQEPNDRKSAQIPKEHWPAIGPSDHVKDAYRHARYYTLANRGTKI